MPGSNWRPHYLVIFAWTRDSRNKKNGNYTDAFLLTSRWWNCDQVARKCRYLGVISPHRAFHVAGMGVSRPDYKTAFNDLVDSLEAEEWGLDLNKFVRV